MLYRQTLRTVLLLAMVGLMTTASAATHWAYFGTYTDGTSKGIYVAEFDGETGKFGPPKLAAELVNPSFLTIHPNGKFLYAVSEQPAPNGGVSAFAIDPATGMLQLLNSESSRGSDPCHLNVDASGKMLTLANYSSGSVVSYSIAADGKLSKPRSVEQHTGSGANKARQEAPHAHSVNYSPGNKFVIAADLGLDALDVYGIDPEQGTLENRPAARLTLAPGSGPRHFAFHPDGKRAYVVNELASTVISLAWDDAAGQLTAQQTISTLPTGFSGSNSTAEILVHPSGHFVYASNRGDDSIAIFRIHDATGMLHSLGREPTRGMQPRNFRITPDGRFLLAANQKTNSVVVFAIDAESGKLRPTGEWLALGSPVCIRFLAKAN